MHASSHADYIRNIVVTYEERHRCKLRKYTSPGQAEDPPLLEDLPKQQPQGDERKVLGEAGYGATATRVDIALGVARLARFVERWGVWAAAELLRLLGYLSATWEVELHFLWSCGVTLERQAFHQLGSDESLQLLAI